MSVNICTTEMHTVGGPVRIVTSGFPEVKGRTIIEKRRYIRENLDHYRTMLMHEPRGHSDMYGAILVPVDDDSEADVGVIFMDNEGYSNMCGHATIALSRYIVDNKLTKSQPAEDATVVTANLLCPCGIVQAEVSMNNGVSGAVKFTSVPSFAYKLNVELNIPGYGDVVVDMGYGGAFYAFVDMNQTDMNLMKESCDKLVHFATAVSDVVKKQVNIEHPEEKDLSYLYGTILTDGKDAFSVDPAYSLCVFADQQVDRSPCGSGTSARLAVQYAKQLIGLNQKRPFRNSKVDSEFIGEVVMETKCGSRDAIRVSVQGQAYYTGTSEFSTEDNDPLKYGFMVR